MSSAFSAAVANQEEESSLPSFTLAESDSFPCLPSARKTRPLVVAAAVVVVGGGVVVVGVGVVVVGSGVVVVGAGVVVVGSGVVVPSYQAVVGSGVVVAAMALKKSVVAGKASHQGVAGFGVFHQI